MQTPYLDEMVRTGIELDRQYVCACPPANHHHHHQQPPSPDLGHPTPPLTPASPRAPPADKYCSPTRTAIQSGRNPFHVNPLNLDPTNYNPKDPVSGFSAMPRNSTSPFCSTEPRLMMMRPLTRRLRAVTGMATKLAAAGYMTHFAGKWYGNPTRCCQPPASLTALTRECGCKGCGYGHDGPHAAWAREMQARLHEIKATAFLPDRGPVDTKASCGAAMGKWGGFWGPFVE